MDCKLWVLLGGTTTYIGGFLSALLGAEQVICDENCLSFGWNPQLLLEHSSQRLFLRRKASTSGDTYSHQTWRVTHLQN